MCSKITISIVAYDNYDDIRIALKSLEQYTDRELEKHIFIIDNGSRISCKEDIDSFKSFIKQFVDVDYIDAGENLGFGRGHNKVLDIIDSEYHAIVNPDIIFCEDAFSEIIDWMDENPHVGMVIPNIVDENGDRQLVYRKELTVFDMFARFFCKGIFKKRVREHTLQDMDYSKPFQVPFGQGSFLVIRSNLFKELEGFDENFFMYVEDADLCKRVNQVSKLMYFPGAKVIHKWEKGSHSNKKLFRYHILSMKYYFKKWGVKWL